MRKHIVITKLFDSGGSNAHFKTLVKYFEKETVILILEDKRELERLHSIVNGILYKTLILENLHGYAHLRYLFSTNLKELFFIVKSILSILLISIRHGFADVTVSAVEPEKHLYFLWIPFIKVNYILHTEPAQLFTPFTTLTCKINLGRNTRLITVSNDMKKAIIGKWKIIDTKHRFIDVIYNCVTEEDFVTDLSPHSPSLGNKTIVTMGHVDQRKNPFLWLKVAKAVLKQRQNIDFIWLGNGPYLDHFINATNNYENIHFLGLVTNRQPFLNECSIYYQPSLIEPQGIAVLEAMYHGKACVVANVGGLPESVLNNFNGILVNPNNLKENVDSIINLLDNDKLRLGYGSNSSKRYQDMFTYNSFKSKMNAVYNS
ncbi:MAG: hypothetical protein JWN56_1422 [Sphingobacteriales bacterium]|nr:hypothetical protein [Sphingobacteriales bacterium]